MNYPVQLAAFAIAAALVVRLPCKPFVVRLVGAAVVCVLAITVYSLLALYDLSPLVGMDYRIFWGVGHEVWSGGDPYATQSAFNPVFVNPPTALPLFTCFAALPGRASFFLFTIFNLAACIVLPYYAQAMLLNQECVFDGRRPDMAARWRLSSGAMAGLTLAIAGSDAVLAGLALGQLCALEALLLLAALDAQSRGWPIMAGIWLSVATIKVATMLPFLLLFLRRQDGKTWLSLAVASAVLLGITGHLTELRMDLSAMVDRVARMSAPGHVNDISFEGTQHVSMIGLDHLLFRLGVRERWTIRVCQGIGTLVMALWVVRHATNGKMPRAAACSLVALFSMLFLYHRSYDAVILVLPLVYLAGRARSEDGEVRWLAAAGAIMILFVLYLRSDSMRYLTAASLQSGAWGRLVQALALPYATWFILVAMLVLVLGERRAAARYRRQPGMDPASAQQVDRAGNDNLATRRERGH